MKKIFAPALFALATVALIAPVAAGPFDGTWKVRRTGVGCTPKGVIKVQVNETTISGSYVGGSGKHVITGQMANTGAFTFTAQSPRDTVVFSGAITGKKGKGRWSVDGRACGGKLRIYR